AGDRDAKANLAVNDRGAEALPSLLQDETADHAIVGFRPDDENISDGRIGDPRLGSFQRIAALYLAGARFHRAWVRAVVRLRQPEAADQLTLGKLGEILLALLL